MKTKVKMRVNPEQSIRVQEIVSKNEESYNPSPLHNDLGALEGGLAYRYEVLSEPFFTPKNHTKSAQKELYLFFTSKNKLRFSNNYSVFSDSTYEEVDTDLFIETEGTFVTEEEKVEID